MGMNDSQLYLAAGLPVFAVLMNIIAGVVQHGALMARFSSIDNRFTNIDNRFTSVEGRFVGLDARFETLTGKVIEID
jgi:hypothetical protein